MSRSKVLDDFGKKFIEYVRDKPISQIDTAFLSEEGREKIYAITPFIVDTVIAHALDFFQDDRRGQIVVKTEDQSEVNISEVSDGLAGELYGDDGWVKKYSQQRD